MTQKITTFAPTKEYSSFVEIFKHSMLSRHNIRIKVLQTLYAHWQNEDSSIHTADRNYLKAIHSSYRLYLYNLYFLQRIADYNWRDFDIKTHKYLPTEEDRQASLKLYENPIAKALRDNSDFQRLLKDEALAALIDEDFVRTLYQKFTHSEYYPTYVQMQSPPMREHQYCMVNLYKFILQEELFQEHIEDHFPMWEEDLSLLYAAVKNTIRQLPDKKDFFKEFEPNPEFVREFGRTLLLQAVKHDKDLQPIIAERLQNWQEDRVAMMDMLIIKLGLCEFLYHPSIPTKVTIDEYVSISKEYSTDKSKRFINGILDRLMHDLQTEGRIQKTGRGLIEE